MLFVFAVNPLKRAAGNRHRPRTAYLDQADAIPVGLVCGVDINHERPVARM
jgi:hypothetical protein